MSSNQIHLFATRADLEPIIRIIEGKRALKYFRCGLWASPDVCRWHSLLEVKSLGIATAVNHTLCERFLVMGADAELQVRHVPQKSGGIKFAVDQLENPASIVCQFGGVYGDGFLICGHIGTASSHRDSVGLYREFSRLIIKEFQKHGHYFVGAEALELQHRGVRLITMHITEDTEYDLKVEKAGLRSS
jgi:hypothetical protein